MPRRHRQRAYTMLEAVISLTISGILLTGLGSTILMASRALPDSSNALRASVAAARVANDMTTELLTAINVTELTPTAVTLTVADRTGDSVDESIRYAWSGTAGAPLTRRYNAGASVAVLDGVNQFALDYDVFVDGAGTQPAQETTYPFSTIVDIPLDGASPEQEFLITTTDWCGQYFAPDPGKLPADTVRWKVDRIMFRAKASGRATGMTAVQLRAANPDRTPAATVIEQFLLDEKTLDSKNWTAKFFDFTAAPWLTPAEGICLVLAPSANDATALILHQMTLDNGAFASFLQSTNSGAAFTADGTNAMTMFTVYATVVTSTPGTATATRLRLVKIEINAGANDLGSVETSAALLNLPKVTLP